MAAKRSGRRTAAAWAATLLIAGLGLAIGAPSASAAPAHPAFTHCRTVVEKIRPDQAATRVVAQSCSGSSQPTAVALDLTPIVTPTAVYTPLLIQYENLNYGGRSNVLYGTNGPCDLSGYSINRNQWGTLTSSVKWASNCTMIDAFHDANQSGFCVHFFGNVGYVGARLNDHVFSYHLSSGSDWCNQ
jgi:hypothetical protein